MVANIIGYKPTSMSRGSEIHEICNFRQHNKWIFISVCLCKSAITVLRTLWATIVWLTTCVNPIIVSSFLNSRRHYNCLVFVCGGPTPHIFFGHPDLQPEPLPFHITLRRPAAREENWKAGRQVSFSTIHLGSLCVRGNGGAGRVRHMLWWLISLDSAQPRIAPRNASGKKLNGPGKKAIIFQRIWPYPLNLRSRSSTWPRRKWRENLFAPRVTALRGATSSGIGAKVWQRIILMHFVTPV